MRDPILSPSFDSWLFMLDSDPNSEGIFKYSYLFVNIHTREIVRYDGCCYWNEDKYLGDNCLILKSPSYKAVNEVSCATKTVFSSSCNNYAVILSGGYNPYNNFVRYWNSCHDIYHILKNLYGYQDDHIFVLMSDGTNPAIDRNNNGVFDSSPLDLDEDGISDIDGAATYSNLQAVVDTLANITSSGDQILFFVTDHGDSNGNDNSTILLWNQTSITDTDFALLVSEINPGTMMTFVMGQCYSGGFIDNLSSANRVILTSCRGDEQAIVDDQGRSTFLYEWMQSVRGYYQSLLETDNQVSFSESFSQANTSVLSILDGRNHPQYDSNPSNLGEHHCLLEDYIYLPHLFGPSNISYNPSICSVLGLPSGVTINWTTQSNIYGIAVNDTTFAVRGNGYSEAYFGNSGRIEAHATVGNVIYSSSINNIGLWKSGYCITETLINASVRSGLCEVTLDVPTSSYSDYVWSCDKESWTPQYSGYPYCEFDGDPDNPPTSVWVVFNNPLGEQTTVIYNIQTSDYL